MKMYVLAYHGVEAKLMEQDCVVSFLTLDDMNPKMISYVNIYGVTSIISYSSARNIWNNLIERGWKRINS
jgi:hypothetical protein